MRTLQIFGTSLLAIGLLCFPVGCEQRGSGTAGQGGAGGREPLERERETQMKPIDLSGSLRVSVTYRERIMLPAGSTVRVVLEDVSKADAPAVTIAEQSMTVTGAPPYVLEVLYDPEALDNRATYAVRATIERDGRRLFTSDTHTPVLTGGAPKGEVELVLVSAAAPRDAGG
ncbi:MAG TPA: YbaY family lipoprotein [Phycisphaerales bacterium]|nr:YbaY family lipoprotein [Phycisphaerales bacterium]HMP38411.1 YbaY family lipoprotein [Phycisphaerales bacterium]